MVWLRHIYIFVSGLKPAEAGCRWMGIESIAFIKVATRIFGSSAALGLNPVSSGLPKLIGYTMPCELGVVYPESIRQRSQSLFYLCRLKLSIFIKLILFSIFFFNSTFILHSPQIFKESLLQLWLSCHISPRENTTKDVVYRQL